MDDKHSLIKANELYIEGKRLHSLGQLDKALVVLKQADNMLRSYTEFDFDDEIANDAVATLADSVQKSLKRASADKDKKADEKIELAIANSPLTLKIIVLAVFCMWTIFSVQDTSYWLTVVGYVLLCWIVPGVLQVIPFIGPFILQPLLPVGWELLWRDSALSGVSALAWGVCAVVFIIDILDVLIRSRSKVEVSDEIKADLAAAVGDIRAALAEGNKDLAMKMTQDSQELARVELTKARRKFIWGQGYISDVGDSK